MCAVERPPCSLALALALATLAACGGDAPAVPADDAGAARDAAADDVADGEAEAAFEGCSDNVPAFSLGMQARVVEGAIHASLVAAAPEPPMRYLNDWTIALTDAQGEPLEDVRIESARPFMPVHGHDGNLQPRVRGASEPGQFSIADLNLFMRGPWEVQLRLHSDRAGDGYVVFDVCIAE